MRETSLHGTIEPFGPGACHRPRVNSMEQSATTIRKRVAWAIAIAAPMAVPTMRHVFIYNAVPLIIVCLLLLSARKRLPFGVVFAGVVLLCALVHLHNILSFGIHTGVDSEGYIFWGSTFAGGWGFPGMIYRPPGYAFFLGVVFSVFDLSLGTAVWIQHLLLLACVPMVFALARQWHFDRFTALCAALLLGLNSLSMQMARYIMSEALFMFGLCVLAVFLTRMARCPGLLLSVGCGLWAAAVQHVRQLVLPFFLCAQGVVLAVNKRSAVRSVVVSVGLFLVLLVPWSLHNYIHFESFALSEHFGVNIFTKATSYNLIDTSAAYFTELRRPYANVLRDMDLSPGDRGQAPEDDWEINRMPHVVLDTLVQRGYGYGEASDLLARVSLASFARRPAHYVASIVPAFMTLLFRHREMYPSVDEIFPAAGILQSNGILFRLVRGLVYADGWILVAGILMCLAACRQDPVKITPFCIVLGGYALTAAVHVGFTRYAIPWIPMKMICVAWVVSSAARGISEAACRVRRKHLDRIPENAE